MWWEKKKEGEFWVIYGHIRYEELCQYTIKSPELELNLE